MATGPYRESVSWQRQQSSSRWRSHWKVCAAETNCKTFSIRPLLTIMRDEHHVRGTFCEVKFTQNER